MDPPFQERLAPLREAQDALREEMERLIRAGAADEAILARLFETGRSGQEQAHSLLVTMFFEGTTGELVQAAEDLVGFFTEVVRQLEVMRAPDKRAN